jgi:hypothetical protein
MQMMESLSKADDVTAGDHAWPGNVGYYHTPKRFLSMAKQTLHPRDTTDHLEVERKKNLLQAMLLAAQMRLQEDALHASPPECLQKVLHVKKILVWPKFLEKFQHEGMAVVGRGFWRSFNMMTSPLWTSS